MKLLIVQYRWTGRLIVRDLRRSAGRPARAGRGAGQATSHRRRRGRRPSIRLATGCRSSPTTGASAWCLRRRATMLASRSRWRGRKSPMRGIRRTTKRPAISASTTAPHRSCISRRAFTSPGRTTTRCASTPTPDPDADVPVRKAPATPGKRTWQGNSVAVWEARRANNPAQSARYLKVTTTNMLAGIPAQERRAVRRERRPDRILRSCFRNGTARR